MREIQHDFIMIVSGLSLACSIGTFDKGKLAYGFAFLALSLTLYLLGRWVFTIN